MVSGAAETESETSPHHPEDAAGCPSSQEGCKASLEAGASKSTFVDEGCSGSFQLPPPDFNNISGPVLAYFQKYSSFSFDETISVTFFGYKASTLRLVLYYLLGLASLGSLFLICHWFPKLRARLKYYNSPLCGASYVFCVSSLGTFSFERVISTTDNSDILFRLFDADDKVLSFFEYNYNRFILNPKTGLFVAVQDFPRLPEEVQDNAFFGLDSTIVSRQRQIFGFNDVRIQTKGTLEILFDQVLHPFNMFQIFSIVVWCFEDYFIYSSIIFVLAIVSISTTLIEMRRNFARLREMAHFESKVNVLRQGEVSEISSVDLVPGDTIILSNSSLSILPCDLILLNGEIIVDESMLTGESVPITKLSVLELHESSPSDSLCSPLDVDDSLDDDVGEEPFDDDEDLEDQDFAPNETINITLFGKPEEVPNRSLLYAGTKMIRARIKHGREALGIVLNTGFYTAKGNLIQSILFPRPNKFQFHKDSLSFIAFMGVLACISFIFCLVAMARMGYPVKAMLMRALDLITVVVPPALPATMSIGAAFAMARLRQKAIFCVSPPKISVSSTIDRMCFDKTGTLTEEGLRLKGVIASENMDACISDPKELKPLFVRLMATAHSIQSVNGELVGDPLDIEMLSFTGWTLADRTESIGGVIVSSIIRQRNLDVGDIAELGILKTFEFNSNLRRMTVLVREFHRKEILVFSKGSPEGIKEICNLWSLPPNYDSILASFARRGFRLLACASKTIRHLPWLNLKRYTRESAESSLSFIGFLVFENPLKPHVGASLKVLQHAGIVNVICTGDNPLTAVCVARACGIVSPGKPLYLASLTAGEGTNEIFIEFENLDDPDAETVPLEMILMKGSMDDIELAISGAVFEHLTHEETCCINPVLLKKLLCHCNIYARMSPQQKQLLVEILQSYEQVVGFCGDGANDCGALKAADVGISLSLAEASIAAPFTSRVMDIACVPALIKEGRASLATSFACFKFMTLYSMIQYTSLSCLFLFRSYLTDSQFIYSDLLMILPLGILLSRFGPAKKLAPRRPPSRLMSAAVLSSILSAIVLQAIAQFLNVFLSSYWRPGPGSTKTDASLQNSAVFLTSAFFYPLVACVFSVQFPHRQVFYLPFYLFILMAFALSVSMTFGLVPNWLKRLFSLGHLQVLQAVQIFMVSIGAIALITFMEFVVIPASIDAYHRRKYLPSRASEV